MEPLPPPPEAGAADMLSSLPAHLLDEILTRLHIRALLRTSALSCAWRHRWESLPGLALCFPKGTHPSVIDHVLLRYTGSRISRFVSHDIDNDYRDYVAHWLVALSRLSVESIKIHKEWAQEDSGEQLTLHSSIFSCDRLKSLNLHNCSIPFLRRSGFAGFPVLEELYLSGIFFPYPNEKRVLEAIIRGSPLLRVLELVELFPPDECMIEAPILQTLVLVLQNGRDDDDVWRFGRLPCLQYAKIDVPFIGEHRLLEFFAGVSQVQELIFVVPEHHDMAKIHRIPFTFHNLKRLEIETFAFMEPSFLLFSLLRSSPNLEELKIKIRTFKPKWVTNSDILSEEWTDAQWTDDMCDSLQVVQIDSILQLCPLSFLKLILSKARLLRTLSVDVLPVSQDNPLYELLKSRKASAQAQILFELQKCRKASAQAQILFKEVDLDSDSDGEDLDSDWDDKLDSDSDGEDLDSDSDGEVN